PGATVTLYAIWNPYRATGDTIAPTLRYDFDADSGTSVVDGSGGSLGGTWVGTPAYVDGVTGRAASMSGGANYVKLPLKAGLTDASGSFSYSFWMQEQSRTSYGPFVSNQDFVSCNNAGLSIYNQATQGVLEACWGQSAGGTREYIHGGSGVLTGAWHYLSVVVDRAANTLTLYVDGTQTATQPTGSVTASTLFTSGLAFNIGGLGGSETDTSDGYSNFWVDDFDYYAAAVPAAQIANDWAATRPAAIHYTIAFDGNGATDGSMPPQQMTSYTPAPLATNAFVRPGYSFGGWATTPGGDATYADRQSVSDLTATADATVTLYAVWMRIQPSDAGFIT
ncbi:LamG-like jellyroll fold domain-containing protein, partial [Mesorhizobium japonicum]|uniref:LamG-like jellyroll fold domain-containing protein n=1 Tax=Mesorhizobium japonicum TaxID=2066070 RepID=UPI003B5BEC07